MDEVGAVFVFVFFLALIWVGGFMFGVLDVRDECRDYGATKMFGTMYECREGERK